MKKIIKTENAPAPIGPYNQAVAFNNMLFVSGQIPVNPETGSLITGSITEEAVQSMKNIEAILQNAGMTFDHVVKSTIFLSSMDNFAEVNEVYGSYFEEETAPARETVAVKTLPKNANVEISVIAIKPEG